MATSISLRRLGAIALLLLCGFTLAALPRHGRFLPGQRSMTRRGLEVSSANETTRQLQGQASGLASEPIEYEQTGEDEVEHRLKETKRQPASAASNATLKLSIQFKRAAAPSSREDIKTLPAAASMHVPASQPESSSQQQLVDDSILIQDHVLSPAFMAQHADRWHAKR